MTSTEKTGSDPMAAEKGAAGGEENKKKKTGDEDDDDDVEYLQFKVIILGDGAVGKTSTIMRFSQDYFAAQYKQTLGIDFFSREVVLPGNVQCSLQLWDIGGQSIGSKMLSSYVLGTLFCACRHACARPRSCLFACVVPLQARRPWF